MPKHLIRRYLPDHAKVRAHRHLQLFGVLLHDPNLWHLNRRSASGAFAVGLFTAFVPVPFQMLLAAGAAILARVNLPLSVALVWVTNPVTIPPMFFFAYRVGTLLLGEPERAVSFEFTMEWFAAEMAMVWQPLLLGCLILGTVSAALGYTVIRALWRVQVVRHYMRKKRERAEREDSLSDGCSDD